MTVLSAPTPPRFEHRTDPGPALGLATGRPRLTWTVPTAPDGYVQSAYEIEVQRGGPVESWVVETPDQVLVPWAADALSSRESARVRVRVRGEEWSAWSESAVVEAGLLSSRDWVARFVSPASIGGLRQPAPQLSGSATFTGEVVSARLYATAHGVLEARLNGVLVDDTVLAPGWTAYEHRLRYRAYDVTHLVREGVNDLDIVLGNGWWRGRFGFLGERALYGDRLALLAQLEVTTADGEVYTLATDEGWTARNTGILADDIYDGQITDLRIDSSQSSPTPVELQDADLAILVGEDGPPMRVTQVIPAERVWTTSAGKTLVDFGQNAVGWVRLRTRGRAGDEVTVRHAEVLDGEDLGTQPLRSARATDTYFLSGGDDVLESRFSFHGFRFAEVSGIDDLDPANLELIVIGSDLRRTGWFDSSHALLNRFHENVVWGMRGNFLDVPTDCPQRDERLGWTGDIQIFAPAATYLFDTAGFLASWAADLAAEQTPDGRVPHVIPDILRTELTSTAAAAWGDAATVVPWTVWERIGDTGILERQFPSMRAWVDHLVSEADDDLVWRGGYQYGDWLDPTAPADDPFLAKSDRDVIATAHFARSADLVARAARVLGRHDDAEHYEQLASSVRDAFDRAFVTPSGLIISDAQTVYGIALHWGIIRDAEKRAAAGKRLADLVRAGGFRIATGFVGTPVICDALTDAGFPELAHRLLLQTQAPSWLYPVTMDATTVWERWDSLLADGSINPSGMTSFNHYALGSIVDWVHRSVAGLAPSEAGYRRISVRPVPPTALQHATARHLTPYGEASVSWTRDGGILHLEVIVPVGVRADVELPWGAGAETVAHGAHHWDVAEPTATVPAITDVRDVVDDEELWTELTRLAVAERLATSDADVAKLLAPYFDHPVHEIERAVWTRIWPATSTKDRLAALVSTFANRSGVDHA